MTIFTNNISESTTSNNIAADSLIDATQGVMITGGSAGLSRIIENGDGLVMHGGNADAAAFAIGHGSSTIRYGMTADGVENDTKNVEFQLYNVKNLAASASGYQYIYRVTVNDPPGDINQFYAFSVDGSDRAALNATTNVGFFSNLDISSVSGSSSYNIYAAGSAPNYFDGSVYINSLTNIPGLSNTSGGFQVEDLGSSGVGVFASRVNGTALFLNRNNDGVIQSFQHSGVVKGSISITSSAVAFNTTSDYRLKENVVELEGASDRVLQLNPVRFNFISNPGNEVDGFLAHEAQEVVPEAVSGTKDAQEAIGTLTDFNGDVLKTDVTKPSADELTFTSEVEVDGVTTQVVRTRTWTATGTRPTYQGIDQSKLVPLLTKALQEALVEIDNLKSRLDILES